MPFEEERKIELNLIKYRKWDTDAPQTQGSDVTAVFWGTFAATRGVAIFAAILASPNIIMFVFLYYYWSFSYIGQCSYSWYHSPIIKLSLFQLRISFVIRWTLANRWSSFTISGLGSLVLCLWGEVYSGISLIITNRFSWQSTPPQQCKLNTKLAQRLFLSARPFSELAWHRYLPPASSGLSGDWRQVFFTKK